MPEADPPAQPPRGSEPPADPLAALTPPEPAPPAEPPGATDLSAVSLELPHDLEAVDQQIARLALLCRVRLLERPVLERVLRNDDSVCGQANPRAFAELHGLLHLHFKIQHELTENLGAEAARQTIDHIHASLCARLGAHLAELR